MVLIKGLSKAAVLASLYNHSHPQGMGFLQYDPADMTEGEAAAILDDMRSKGAMLYFDYLKGRVMKVSLDSDDEIDERLYDRDNGVGAAQRAINSITKS